MGFGAKSFLEDIGKLFTTMLLLLINKFLWKLLVDVNGTDKMYLFDYYGFLSVTSKCKYIYTAIVTLSQLNVKFYKELTRNKERDV